MMNRIFNIPGATWVALLVLLAGWLEQYFPNEVWLASVLGLIGLVVKGVEVFWPAPAPTLNERMEATAQPDTVGRKVLRVLFG